MEIHDLILFLGRLLLGGHYLISGVRHLMEPPPRIAVLTKRGVPWPRQSLYAAAIFQVVCSLLLIAGLWPVWAAGGLIAFTLLATPIFHNFWDEPAGPSRARELHNARNNSAFIGGLLATIAASL